MCETESERRESVNAIDRKGESEREIERGRQSRKAIYKDEMKKKAEVVYILLSCLLHPNKCQ